MNIGFYYHTLPPVDDMLYASTPPDMEVKASDAIEGWRSSEIDAFIVVGVTDEQIRTLYSAVKQRSNTILEQMHRAFESNDCVTYLKRLYRFDTVASAKRYIDYLTSWREDDFEEYEDYEDHMQDRIDCCFFYEEPWVFARELTEQDWEDGGLFYDELHTAKDREMEELDWKDYDLLYGEPHSEGSFNEE